MDESLRHKIIGRKNFLEILSTSLETSLTLLENTLNLCNFKLQTLWDHLGFSLEQLVNKSIKNNL